MNRYVNAFEFVLEKILDKGKSYYNLPRPRKDKRLPKVLSEIQEKKRMDQVENAKHRAILMTIYSCGLRISKLINLEVADIDSSKKLVLIRRSKGAKDR